MYRVSSLGRPIDPRFSSNIVAVGGSAFAGIAVGIYNLAAASPIASSPLMVAIGVFIAWAIGRELDPDNPASATLAMAVSFVALVNAPGELMLGVGVLLASRVISGTVGAPLRAIDSLALVALAWLLGAGGMTIVALPGLLLAGVFGGATRSKAVSLAAGMVVAAAGGFLVARPLLGWEAAGAVELVALGLTAGGLLAGPRLTSVAASADLGGTLSARRITVSRRVAAAAVVLGFLVGGGIGISAAFPMAGAAVVASGVVGFLGRRYDSSMLPTKERVSSDAE